MLTKLRTFFALGAFTTLLLGCDGVINLPNGNNTDEVAQFMPDDVTLDVSELPDEDATAKSINSAMPNPETQRRGNAMNNCGGMIHGFHHAAARALALGAKIRDDMTGPDNVFVAGEFSVGRRTVKYLADFSAFDFDGDGTADGSGNAVDVPVALRMWTDRGKLSNNFFCPDHHQADRGD
ncbi:MAG: hypothetical protein IPK83_18895 [Planctomycetes bacterium]|nr:hypothetical protein [Planctomycetota bacterium]